jgi:hypothetical protein
VSGCDQTIVCENVESFSLFHALSCLVSPPLTLPASPVDLQKRLPDDYPPSWVHNDIDDLRARWAERAVPLAASTAGGGSGTGGLVLVPLPPYGPEVSRKNKVRVGRGLQQDSESRRLILHGWRCRGRKWNGVAAAFSNPAATAHSRPEPRCPWL